VTTGRIRLRAVGAVLAVLLVGVVPVWGQPAVGTAAAASAAAPPSAGAIVSAQETTDTGTTGQSSSGGAGSWWAFGLVLFGLAAGIGGIFFWDLYKTNRRQDNALEYLKRNSAKLSEIDRARVLDKLTTGTEGLTRGLLGFSLIGLFAISLLYLLIRNPVNSNSDVVQNAMAALITLVTAVVSFYFGTRSAQTSISSLPPLPPGDVPEEGQEEDGPPPPPDEDGPPPPPDEDGPPPDEDGPPPPPDEDSPPPPPDEDSPPPPPDEPPSEDEPPPPPAPRPRRRR
jgi:hypothetical protein